METEKLFTLEKKNIKYETDTKALASDQQGLLSSYNDSSACYNSH